MYETIRGVIFDIEVCWIPGRGFLRRDRNRAGAAPERLALRFLTNSTLKNRQTCAEKLNRKGFQIDPSVGSSGFVIAAVYMRD